MEDVAERAGVSTATVSRTLNSGSPVAAETRERVRQAAAELGYVVHRQAQALGSSRSDTIAVHVPYLKTRSDGHLGNPFVLEFFAAAGAALHRHHLDMLVSPSAAIDLSLHRSGFVDGYIQLGKGEDDAALVDATHAGVPLAVWTPPRTDRPYCAVGVDNVALAHQATAHLLTHGRHRVALISGDLHDKRSEGSARHDGYRSALEEAGIAYDSRIVANANRQELSGVQAIRQILEADPSVDGVFVAHSDVVAVSAKRELADQGISVPDDIAIVGFDNIQMADFTHPRLTTVDQNLNVGVRLLVDKLLQQIEGAPPTSQLIEGRLMVRESCGAQHTTSEQAAPDRTQRGDSSFSS